ncbi:hypothetical protein ACQ4PT_065408 [Festuca glaucescens]
MGDNDGGVAKLCETMQKMLRQLMEQSQAMTSGSFEALKTLEPNPVKLTGPVDFFGWSRNALLILESHGLQKFLKEDEKKAAGVPQEQWDQNSKRVMVWLLGSMEKSVREQVEGFQTAAKVWSSIEKQFSGKSNKMQVSRILHEMTHIKQDQKSVTQYAGELKRLYRDLEFFRPFKPHDPRDLSLLREWFEPILIQVFLEGLNPDFNLRSQMILATPEWSTLDQTITSILEEETRLANQGTIPQGQTDNRAAFSHLPAYGTPRGDQANVTKFQCKQKKMVVCDHCKKPGHEKRDCFELVGYPLGWKRRQVNKPMFGGSQERRQGKVNFTSSSGELPAVTAQAVEEFKAKLMVAASDGPSESSKSPSTGGSQVGKRTWDWN